MISHNHMDYLRDRLLTRSSKLPIDFPSDIRIEFTSASYPPVAFGPDDYMNHLTDEQIDGYCRERFSLAERESIAAHCMVCAPCMARVLEEDLLVNLIAFGLS